MGCCVRVVEKPNFSTIRHERFAKGATRPARKTSQPRGYLRVKHSYSSSVLRRGDRPRGLSFFGRRAPFGGSPPANPNRNCGLYIGNSSHMTGCKPLRLLGFRKRICHGCNGGRIIMPVTENAYVNHSQRFADAYH